MSKFRSRSLGAVNPTNPVNPSHFLNRKKVGWWIGIPGVYGNAYQVRDIMPTGKPNPVALTSMGSATNGWRPTSRPGGYGHLLFDGSAGYLTDSGSSATNPTSALTVAFSVRASGVGGAQFAGRYDATLGGSSWLIWSNTNDVRFYTQDGGGADTLIYASSVFDGTWHRVMCTWDGANKRIYVDGLLVAGPSAYSLTLTTNSTPMQIGGSAALGRFLGGEMDDIGLWSRGLSAADARYDHLYSRSGYAGALNRMRSRMSAAALSGHLLSLRRRMVYAQ